MEREKEKECSIHIPETVLALEGFLLGLCCDYLCSSGLLVGNPTLGTSAEVPKPK